MFSQLVQYDIVSQHTYCQNKFFLECRPQALPILAEYVVLTVLLTGKFGLMAVQEGEGHRGVNKNQ